MAKENPESTKAASSMPKAQGISKAAGISKSKASHKSHNVKEPKHVRKTDDSEVASDVPIPLNKLKKEVEAAYKESNLKAHKYGRDMHKLDQTRDAFEMPNPAGGSKNKPERKQKIRNVKEYKLDRLACKQDKARDAFEDKYKMSISTQMWNALAHQPPNTQAWKDMIDILFQLVLDDMEDKKVIIRDIEQTLICFKADENTAHHLAKEILATAQNHSAFSLYLALKASDVEDLSKEGKEQISVLLRVLEEFIN